MSEVSICQFSRWSDHIVSNKLNTKFNVNYSKDALLEPISDLFITQNLELIIMVHCIPNYFSLYQYFCYRMPFYYEIKIIFVIWLLSPMTKGSSFLFKKFVHPQLKKREKVCIRIICLIFKFLIRKIK